MSEENNTAPLPGAASFEARIFARFDAMDERLAKLEKTIDERSYETKPIWERALAEIIQTRDEMRAGFRNVERQIGVLSKDVVQLRADLSDVVSRLGSLETPAKS
jgi:hypothetical protein